MGELLSFGNTVSSLTINRVNIDFNQVGYVVLLDNRVLAKQVAYFEGFGYVEMTQEDVINTGKNASTCYIMLAARLNTDQRGTVYGDDITVEYMRMSQRQYNSLCAGFQAVPGATALMIRKERNVNAQGKDVSSVSYTPAMLELSPAVVQKLELLRANPATIQGLFTQVDSLTGVPIAKYHEWLAAKAGQGAVADTAQGVLPPAGPMPTTPPAQVVHGGAIPIAGPTGYPTPQANGTGVSSLPPVSTGSPAAHNFGSGYPASSAPQSVPQPAPQPAPQQVPPFGQSPVNMGFDGAFAGEDFSGDGGI